MSFKFIAEFCQNHNGNRQILQEMIHQASEAGATYGKIQTIFASDLSKRDRFENGLVVDGVTKVIKRPYAAEYERLKGLEISYDDQFWFIEECKKYKLIPLTTCFTRGHVKRLAEMGWGEIKIASYDCASLPLIKDLSRYFKKLIISTGATFDNEVVFTANYLNSISKDFSFLHCVTLYPTPLDKMHLNRMKYLKKFTPEIGLSNHAHSERDDIKADVAAIYLGSSLIERHFTILKADQSRDGPVSINTSQLKRIIEFSKLSKNDQKLYIGEKVPEFDLMLGSETRELSHQELLNRDYYRGRFTTHVKDIKIENWDEGLINE